MRTAGSSLLGRRSCLRCPSASSRPPCRASSTAMCASAPHQVASTSSSAEPLPFRRREALGLFFTAAMSLSLPQQATAAAVEEPVAMRAIQEYQDQEPKFVKDRKALDDFRAKYNIRRALDGRVSVRAKNGDWYAVRLDMEVPGALLLRNDAGYIFAVQTANVQQVDLSDDFVVLLMFAESDWEQQLSPITVMDESGGTIQLQLDEKQFRDVLGILKELQDMEEDALNEEDGK